MLDLYFLISPFFICTLINFWWVSKGVFILPSLVLLAKLRSFLQSTTCTHLHRRRDCLCIELVSVYWLTVKRVESTEKFISYSLLTFQEPTSSGNWRNFIWKILSCMPLLWHSVWFKMPQGKAKAEFFPPTCYMYVHQSCLSIILFWTELPKLIFYHNLNSVLPLYQCDRWKSLSTCGHNCSLFLQHFSPFHADGFAFTF